MNKLAIPAILAATILVAGIFALLPVEKAATVHTTILASVEHLNVDVFYADAADVGASNHAALADGTDTVLIGVLVTNNAGVPVTTLVAGDFTGVASAADGSAAATLVFNAEVSDGLYTMTLDSAECGAPAIVEYVLIVTVDDANNDVTTEVGTGAVFLSLEVLE